MVPQGGHIAWDHEDDPSNEVRQAEEGVLAHSTKKLIIFRSIYAKTSLPCLPVGRAVPWAAEGDATPHTHADAHLLRRRRVVPPSRHATGRVAGAEEHHKGPRSTSALPAACSTVHHPPALFLSRRRRARGEGKRARSRPSWRGRRCPAPPQRVGGGGRADAAVRRLVALLLTEGLHLHVGGLFAARRRARRTSLTSLFFFAAPATRPVV